MPNRLPFAREHIKRETVEVEVIRVPIPSTSRPNVTHYVSIKLECTCEAFKYRNKCKHIHGLLDEIAPRPKVMQK